MTEEKNELIQILDDLSKNAMFRLSLCSKELFHSNFWAWLIEKDNDLTSVFYDKYKKGIPVKVAREENHFDLSLEIDNNLIIIENKFKSLPDKRQLEVYLNKARSIGYNDAKIILVSYMAPKFKFDNNDNVTHTSYESLLERLCKIDLNNAKFSKNDIEIIKNYICCLELLIKLQKNIPVSTNLNEKFNIFWEKYKYKKNKEKQLEENELRRKLDYINFGLTFQRIFLSQFIECVINEIKDNNLWYQICTGNSHVAYAEFGYVDSDFSICICCNGEYRYMFNMIKSKDCNTRETLINKCKEKYGKFLENKNCKKGRKDYCSFMGKDCAWVYKKKDISEKTFKELVESIKNDLLELKNINS